MNGQGRHRRAAVLNSNPAVEQHLRGGGDSRLFRANDYFQYFMPVLVGISNKDIPRSWMRLVLAS
eukprot:391893-Pelagomonas_calceolata.AAC.1